MKSVIVLYASDGGRYFHFPAVAPVGVYLMYSFAATYLARRFGSELRLGSVRVVTELISITGTSVLFSCGRLAARAQRLRMDLVLLRHRGNHIGRCVLMLRHFCYLAPTGGWALARAGLQPRFGVFQLGCTLLQISLRTSPV